jgi:hypothetical protein
MVLSVNFSDLLINYFNCESLCCSRAMISGLIGNSSYSISSKCMMLIASSSLVSGTTIASSFSTAHIACDSTKASSVSERGSSCSFFSRDSASATMFFSPAIWTYFGPYYSRSNLHLVIRSFDSLPYKIFKWSVCNMAF